MVKVRKMSGAFKILERGRVEKLEREITKVKVSEAIDSYNGNKAPKLDGFNLNFFKR